jgi:hypothetical protein
MGHEHRGHYAVKHAAGTSLNPQIAELIKQSAVDDKITCADAHKIAQALQVSPSEVGVTLDLLEIRISQCQLGLFGYSPQKRIVQPAEQVSPELQAAIADAQNDQGGSCLSAWKIAEQFGIARMDVAAACEALQVKITTCQIGAF